MSTTPVLFVSHGAPTFALEPGRLGPALTATGEHLPRPRAVLVVSPHWMTRDLRVATGAAPATVHDFGGFDRALYEIHYPAPGHPELAARTIEVLQAAGWPALPDEQQGLDHGAWVPLRFLYPAGRRARVPAIPAGKPHAAAGLCAGRGAAAAARRGRAGGRVRFAHAQPVRVPQLRRRASKPATRANSRAWVRQAVEARDDERLQRTLEIAPHAQRAHPTTEHFLPLLVAAGVAAGEQQVQALEGGITYGMLSMDSFLFGAPVRAPA